MLLTFSGSSPDPGVSFPAENLGEQGQGQEGELAVLKPFLLGTWKDSESGRYGMGVGCSTG